jgi:hypothetical protein
VCRRFENVAATAGFKSSHRSAVAVVVLSVVVVVVVVVGPNNMEAKCVWRAGKGSAISHYLGRKLSGSEVI